MLPNLHDALADAKAGRIDAQIELSSYWLGLPSSDGAKQASLWLRPLAEAGHTRAEELYGRQLLLGIGIPPNQKLGAKYLEAAAVKGSRDAQFHFGIACKEGIGVHKSDVEALGWFELAANQGHPAAACALGRYYEAGGPVKPNPSLALAWFKKAAEATLPFSLKVESKPVEAFANGFTHEETLLAIEYVRHLKIPANQAAELEQHPMFLKVVQDVKDIVQSQIEEKDEYVLNLFTPGQAVRKIKEEHRDFFRRLAFRDPEQDFRVSDFNDLLLQASFYNDFEFFRAFGAALDREIAPEKKINDFHHLIVKHWTHTPGHPALCFLSDMALKKVCEQILGPDGKRELGEDAVRKARQRFSHLRKAKYFLLSEHDV